MLASPIPQNGTLAYSLYYIWRPLEAGIRRSLAFLDQRNTTSQ
jgi:hypothetical protein